MVDETLENDIYTVAVPIDDTCESIAAKWEKEIKQANEEYDSLHGEKRIEGRTLSETLEFFTPIIQSIIHNKGYGGIIDKDDLFQEAYIAVWQAFNKADPNSEFKFTTFAYSYINGAIMHFIKRNVSIFGSSGLGAKDKYKRLSNKLENQPTHDDLINAHMKESTIKALMNFSQPTVYLDGYVGEGDTEAHDLTEDKNAVNPYTYLYGQFDDFEWEKYLSEQERKVVVYYFGFNRKTGSLTQTEISRRLNIPLVEVQITLHSALQKLRNNPEIQKMARATPQSSAFQFLPDDVDDKTLKYWPNHELRDSCREETIKLMRQKNVCVQELIKEFSKVLNLSHSGPLYIWCKPNTSLKPRDTLSYQKAMIILDYLQRRPADKVFISNQRGRPKGSIGIGRARGTLMIDDKLVTACYIKPESPIEIPSDIINILYTERRARFKSHDEMHQILDFFQSVIARCGTISATNLYDVLQPHIKNITSSACFYQAMTLSVSADRAREIVKAMIEVEILADPGINQDDFGPVKKKPKKCKSPTGKRGRPRKVKKRQRPAKLITKFKIPHYVYLTPLTSTKTNWKDNKEMFGYMGLVNEMMDYHKIKTADISNALKETRDVVFNWRYKSCTTKQAFMMYKTILLLLEIQSAA